MKHWSENFWPKSSFKKSVNQAWFSSCRASWSPQTSSTPPPTPHLHPRCMPPTPLTQTINIFIHPWDLHHHQSNSHLRKKFFSIGVGAEEGPLQDIEVDALVLGHSLLETQTKVNHRQLCVLSIFLKFGNLKDFCSDSQGRPELASLRWWYLHGSGGFDAAWLRCCLVGVCLKEPASSIPHRCKKCSTLQSNRGFDQLLTN